MMVVMVLVTGTEAQWVSHENLPQSAGKRNVCSHRIFNMATMFTPNSHNYF